MLHRRGSEAGPGLGAPWGVAVVAALLAACTSPPEKQPEGFYLYGTANIDCTLHLLLQVSPRGPDLTRESQQSIIIDSAGPQGDLYPTRAVRMERRGEVDLSCKVDNGTARQCIAWSERPAGYGFGPAAVGLAEKLKFDGGFSGESVVTIQFEGEVGEYCTGRECGRCVRYLE